MSLEHEETEEREVSRAEKVLAMGMVIFLLIGGFWVLGRIGRLPTRPDHALIEVEYDRTHPIPIAELRSASKVAWERSHEARSILDARVAEMAKAFQEYEFRREEYRVLLERGEVGPEQRALHEEARIAYENSQAAVAAAKIVHTQAEEALARSQVQIDVANQETWEVYRRADRAYELQLLLLRLVYVLPVLIGAIYLWQRGRVARSRYLIVATAFLAFGIIQAAVLAFQYSWHLFREAVQVVISIAGTAAAIGGIVVVKRYAGDPRRVAATRLRRGLCYACGFPGVADHGYQHCPGCGAALQSACEWCGNPCPVRAVHCPACGKRAAG